MTATLEALIQTPHTTASDTVTLVLSRQFISDALEDIVALEREIGALPQTLMGLAVVVAAATW